MSVDELIGQPYVEVGSVAENNEETPPAPLVPSLLLPYFPADLPVGTDEPLLLQPVSFVVRISALRRMAKKLVFCSCDPSEGPRRVNHDDLPWRCVSDGKPMDVQLIFGKTLSSQLGEQAGINALRMLKSGQLIAVQGSVGSNAEWGLRNWRSTRWSFIISCVLVGIGCRGRGGFTEGSRHSCHKKASRLHLFRI